MTRTFFGYKKTPDGTVPQVIYEHIAPEDMAKMVLIVELADADKEAVKQTLRKATHRYEGDVTMLSVLQEMFPCPVDYE